MRGKEKGHALESGLFEHLLDPVSFRRIVYKTNEKPNDAMPG